MKEDKKIKILVKPRSGDYVEIHLTRKIYEGVLLEAPVDEKGIVLLKLDSGYNVGINKKEILEIKLIKKGENIEKKEEKIKSDSKKPNIAMIITGGTIASSLDVKTGAVKWLDSPENLFKFYPGVFDKVNILKVEVPFMKGSENMDFKDWQKIARVIVKILNDDNIKGVIITHGTDSLPFPSLLKNFFSTISINSLYAVS